MLWVLAQVLFGFLYANLFEWIWHKYVFHGLGKKRKSKFSSHWKKHHRKVRKNEYVDDAYKSFTGYFDDPMREVYELLFASIIHLPLFFLAPYFVSYLFLHAFAYFMIHRKSHIDPEWAKKWVPWHYDHHMGKNQDANWCVTFPFWDYILGTRLYFLSHEDYNKPIKKHK